MSPEPGSGQRRIAVIVPFFQREPGILARALRSVAQQRLPSDVAITLLLVDDASPVRPQDELRAVDLPQSVAVRIIAQPNSGPAAARNTGLDTVEPECCAIAFLDSDDIWAPDHLATGLAALDAGFDFYFCDSAVGNGSQFAELEAMRCGSAFLPMDDGPDLYVFRPDCVGGAMIREYLCQTSTVVLRTSLVGQQRFNERLRYAGEDWLMWVQLAHRSRRICFSRRAGSIRGEGINLYRGGLARLGARNLRRLLSMIAANHLMMEVPGIDDDSRQFLTARIRRLQRELAAILLHPSALPGALQRETRHAVARLRPSLWRELPGCWASILGKRLAGA